MIPRALIHLRKRVTPEQFSKIRKLLLRYLEHLKSLVGNPFHDMFVGYITAKAIKDVDSLQLRDEATYPAEALRSYTKNVIMAFKQEGPHKEFYTYLTENPNKPQLHNTNKKYPNLP